MQVQVHESQNGAVVLDGGVAAIAITVFGKTVFVLLRVCGRGYFGSWKGLFCVVIGKVCLREQFLINLICRDSASILRVERFVYLVTSCGDPLHKESFSHSVLMKVTPAI